jgi:hypothetical protein
MQKFFVAFIAPASVMAEWMKKPVEERKGEEEKMKADWDAWMSAHRSAIKETAGLGKTKRVTKDGVTDVSNDLMMYSIVEAESADAAAKMFEGHPHFGIPEATLDIMPVNPIPGMN